MTKNNDKDDKTITKKIMTKNTINNKDDKNNYKK